MTRVARGRCPKCNHELVAPDETWYAICLCGVGAIPPSEEARGDARGTKLGSIREVERPDGARFIVRMTAVERFLYALAALIVGATAVLGRDSIVLGGVLGAVAAWFALRGLRGRKHLDVDATHARWGGLGATQSALHADLTRIAPGVLNTTVAGAPLEPAIVFERRGGHASFTMHDRTPLADVQALARRITQLVARHRPAGAMEMGAVGASFPCLACGGARVVPPRTSLAVACTCGHVLSEAHSAETDTDRALALIEYAPTSLADEQVGDTITLRTKSLTLSLASRQLTATHTPLPGVLSELLRNPLASVSVDEIAQIDARCVLHGASEDEGPRHTYAVLLVTPRGAPSLHVASEDEARYVAARIRAHRDAGRTYRT